MITKLINLTSSSMADYQIEETRFITQILEHKSSLVYSTNLTRKQMSAWKCKKNIPVSILRFRIPVRTDIHSSLVSTIFERSSLDIWRVGTADPHPTNLQPLLANLHKFYLWSERYQEHNSNITIICKGILWVLSNSMTCQYN